MLDILAGRNLMLWLNLHIELNEHKFKPMFNMLQYACRDLEQTMSRLNIVLGKVTAEQGKHLETDFAALCSISSVVENNLGMVAAISRASRSYSIGLRNADLEVCAFCFLCYAHFFMARFYQSYVCLNVYMYVGNFCVGSAEHAKPRCFK